MYKGRVESCSKRLYKALSVRGMKQADLCNITGIPKSAMSQYIKGSFEPKQDRIYLLSQALDVSEAWLMGYDVPMEKETLPTVEERLTEAEHLMLELFRRIPEDRQPEALELLQVALKMQKKL